MAIVPMFVGGQRRERSNARPPNIVAVALLVLPIIAGLGFTIPTQNPFPVIAGVLIGIVLVQSPKIAQQWERAIVLRLGRFEAMRGPGLFWVMPFIDRIPSWIDQRTITTTFAAEQTLTSDTVPVNVDAVLFWMVHDAQKAALEVQDYTQAVSDPIHGASRSPPSRCAT
jgi:regulator of protease activity HflC (stomatin/prohibitin superfamily)